MTENLTEQYKDYAVYLPSLQQQYANYATKTNSETNRPSQRIPKNFDTQMLNFLDKGSKLWHCGYTLYSCGQFDKKQIRNRDIVAERNVNDCVVIGDSGGFQLGTGSITSKAELKHLEHFKNDAVAQYNNWQQCDFRERTLRWLDRYTDYAMTLDMVLWAAEEYEQPNAKKSQLRKLSVQQLIDLSVDNLRFFADNRGRGGRGTKFLSVLQDIGNGTGEAWYQAVKDFEFEGYALGSETGRMMDSLRWLRRLLNDGKLDKAEWIHCLMKSPPLNSVVYSAVQRSLQKALGRENFKISLDSSSPSQMAGKNRSFARNDPLTSDIKTWMIGSDAMKQDIRIARGEIQLPVPNDSPLNEFMTLNDMYAHADDYSDYFVDNWTEYLMVNHNMYSFHRTHFEACDLVFDTEKQDSSKVPGQLSEAVELIERYFLDENIGAVEVRLEELLGKFR